MTSRASSIVARLRAEHAAMDGRRAQAERILSELEPHRRVVISGGPRTGKSTLAVRAGERYRRKVRHADSLIGKLDWHGMSDEVSKWLGEDGDWIVEGVTAPRALRKWLAANPDKPLNMTIVHFREPVQTQTDKQKAMSKGIDTVWREILPELKRRGAQVIERDPEAAEPVAEEPTEVPEPAPEPETEAPTIRNVR